MRARSVFALAAVIAAALCSTFTTPASAHYVQPKVPLTKMSPERQVAFWSWSRSYYHWICQRSTAARVRRSHCKAWRWASHELRVAKTKLAPPLPPHYSAWLCIHRGEGAWNDTGDPFWGGLQFMQSTWTRNGGLRYAPTANLATPVQQMWVGENAWHESGGSFSQWPNSARACGLL